MQIPLEVVRLAQIIYHECIQSETTWLVVSNIFSFSTILDLRDMDDDPHDNAALPRPA